MRLYYIFERGGKYRLARPGWFFWHWLCVRNYPGTLTIWETDSLDLAKDRQLSELGYLIRQFHYKHDHWKEVK